MKGYEIEIVDAYVKLIAFVTKYYSKKQSTNTKENLLNLATYAREKFVNCLHNLKKSYDFPQDLLHVVIPANIVPVQEENLILSILLTDDEDEDLEITMTTKEEFYGLATKAIKTYSGDSLGLSAFINSLKLMETMAGDTHKTLLVSIIRTKLEGDAEDAVPESAKTVDDIVAALRLVIKPESSKVLTARLLGLRFDRSKVKEFSKDAEELAENLKRSLVIEGVTPAKASEMVVDETIKMCRATTKSDLVKAVLSATTYTDHKEVVAKLVLESTTEVKEKQVLAYNAQNAQNKFRRGRGRRGGQYNQNNRNYQGKYQGNNSRGNDRNYYNSYRGRGRGRGNYGRGGYNDNNRSVRVIEASGNSEAPQQYQLLFFL